MINFVVEMAERDDNSMNRSAEAPVLYLLPVPLSDVAPELVMPAANIEIVRTVKHFIVENVRSARRFLKRCDRAIDIDSLTFSELNEHTDPRDVALMLAPMAAGNDMAVISEAGCPAVADPGALAVAEAHRRGWRVKPLVGPSSILLALMASGFNGQTWAFAGYLPHDAGRRARALREMQRRIENERQTQIFIETPYRNNSLIAELCQRLPRTMLLCVVSDVTGPRESIVTREISRWAKATYDYDKTPTIFLLYS